MRSVIGLSMTSRTHVRNACSRSRSFSEMYVYSGHLMAKSHVVAHSRSVTMQALGPLIES
jgi:hypothetical protein